MGLSLITKCEKAFSKVVLGEFVAICKFVKTRNLMVIYNFLQTSAFGISICEN
jgi:hypothetical protein